MFELPIEGNSVLPFSLVLGKGHFNPTATDLDCIPCVVNDVEVLNPESMDGDRKKHVGEKGEPLDPALERIDFR
ncbi:hypothetical protein U1Q18_051690, partial [Sarracenia purpurea var. burkii]